MTALGTSRGQQPTREDPYDRIMVLASAYWRRAGRRHEVEPPRSVIPYWPCPGIHLRRWAAWALGPDARSRSRGDAESRPASRSRPLARSGSAVRDSSMQQIRIYTCSHAGLAGYAGAYPAYPVAPPLILPSYLFYERDPPNNDI